VCAVFRDPICQCAYNLAAMEPRLEREDHILRVDGDVLEVFDARYHARRFLLKWLAVRVETLRKSRMTIYIGQNNVDQPLYAKGKQTPAVRGDVLGIGIESEEEPTYRAFFTEVAQLSGRTVA
jgi:hypothetical protein